MKVFTAKSTSDEESLEFFVDEESVGKVCYDEHGSAGMRATTNLFTNMAAQFGAEVNFTWSEY